MYSVYLVDYNSDPTADNPIVCKDELYIYDPITHDEGLALIEPKLSLKASKAGSFSFTIPPTNYGYGRVIRGLTRVVVLKDDKIKFMGRINTEDRDLYLNQKIKAEGALSYLNDTLSEKKTFTYKSLFELLTYIFNNHNNKFPNEPWKQFHLAEVNCKAKFVGRDDRDINSNLLSYYSINFDKSLELVTELVDLAEGALKIEYNEDNGWWDVYIYNKYELPASSNQPIEFGLNLLDLVQNLDMTDICTAVAPFGGDAIQMSKEIGEVVAGWDLEHNQPINNSYAAWYSDKVLARDGNSWNYDIYQFGDNEGYWVFELNIAEYNRQHPNNPLKRLYISWRAYKHSFGDGGNYVADSAWRIDDTSNQNLGHHDLTLPNEQFEAEINEMIDLSEAQYIGAGRIRVGGWGMLLSPIIRRDAVVVEENDKLTIEGCDAFDNDQYGLRHPAGSPYLYSNNLINLYGLIEKKLEYEIPDQSIPVADWTLPYSANGHEDFDFDTTANGPLGAAKIFNNSILGYDISDGDDRNEGNFQMLTQTGDYKVIQYRLPELGDPKRPRGIFLSARTHDLGERDGWRLNGLYAIYDTVWQVLSYKTVANQGFTSIKGEYIDLSDAAYYGAKWIRIASWGDLIPIAATPSDDSYSRDRLMAQAKLYLTDYQWEKVVIEATAVDLNLSTDEWDAFDICTNVQVLSNIHGVETTMPLTELEIQLDVLENNSIVLGYDNDEYLSAQLAESSRLVSVAQTIEERRKNSAN